MARAQGALRENGDDQGTLLGLHDHHRSQTRLPPTRQPDEITMRTLRLLDRTEAGKRPVRLLSVGVHNLSALDLVDTSILESGDRLPLWED